MKILSLGAGVQSTALALMAAKGALDEMPDCAIFADTGWEPKAVYEHLERLKSVVPFPVYVVTAGNLREDLLAGENSTGQKFSAVPWYVRMNDGKLSMGRRQCTAEYKLKPIQRKVVELLGGRPKGGCQMWVGISTDEAARMKPSRVQYIVNRWPLIEKRLNRNDCQQWLARIGWSAPKSACIGCPFSSTEQWRSLTAEEFAEAVKVDRSIRTTQKLKGERFMHRSLKPLDQVDLSTWEERGQADLFQMECEGLCGV